ncbi:basal-body rod modification protein FlgD [Buchnera aphidicola str. Ak (Acyrthosiphon kondoi)]|uniref:Basal-body rod modification protein FlgD n=1 Tax=Buchnera aphidicola str. Ak (Acyrthosiphon kondoi) TaxID=1005090 RepID=G2LN49_9GAMM|nr:flagellar hook assembly protein FlgD [Buchnera aphidicola]AEO08687.1 basal-body rod modification protein FlgD [Buchnera aphidicola str. Ak (Acyrthosiphon kondoi)]WAI18507.1 MAG: flagellar hook assembly protein FlgD [Buchnera aphidicola (Acyrthosiphon caraganae)]
MSTINISNINSPDVNSNIDNELIKINSNSLQNNTNPLDLQKNFLSLLVAQIKNQDPTDPIKNSDLTSQLAQINTANGIERLNNTAIQFSNQINRNQSIQFSSLIGHHVIVPNKEIIHTKDTPTKFGIELVKNATSVEIKILDENNKTLYLKKIKDAKAGIQTFLWDGKDLNKKSVMTGKYKILVTAKNKDQDIPVNSLSEAVVNSIIISSNGPVIDLGAAGKTIPSKISEILK